MESLVEAQLPPDALTMAGMQVVNLASSYTDYMCGFAWFLVICFMFLAQHHTCDAYFVPAINVFVDKMRSSENKWLQRWGEQSVAGATICALGCNGPELFSNLISLFTGSDAGIGVVVGSEIFNLLVIVGSSTLAAPVVPLVLERFSFTRDCIAYALSIAMLFWALQDKKIVLHESLTLLAAAAGYVIAVYFTKDLEIAMTGDGSAEKRKVALLADTQDQEAAKGATGHSFTVDKESLATAKSRSKQDVKHVGTVHGIEVEVEEIYHGRMVDGHHDEHVTITMEAEQDGIHVIDPQHGFQLRSGCSESKAGPILSYKALKEVTVMGEGVIELEFEKGVMAGMLLEHISLKLTCKTLNDRDVLLEEIHKNCGQAWVHGYDSTVVGGWQHFQHAIADPDLSLFLKLVYCVPEFLIDAMLRATLSSVDIKDMTKENRWPLCFIGAMAWLAFFSYCMLECANGINYYIPAIPVAFLGITVCAVGTSFPNAVASVILSSQNKPAAAIANALGSNIQNVFLAMALPWVIFQAANMQNFSAISLDVAGIQEGIMWMVGTLVLLLVLVLFPPCCQLTKPAGIFLNCVYGVYVVITMGETFGWWPPLIPA